MKEYKHEKQDLQQDLSETFKSIIKTQRETKQTIDDKQDKLIEQLQKAITSGLENIVMLAFQPEQPQPQETTKLPISYKPTMMESGSKFNLEANLDVGFHGDEQTRLMIMCLSTSSDVLKGIVEGNIDYDFYMNQLDEEIKRNGKLLGAAAKNKTKNKPRLRAKSKLLKKIQRSYQNSFRRDEDHQWQRIALYKTKAECV